MDINVLVDPVAAHRDAVARHHDATAKAADAQRAVATAETARHAALTAAARGDATADALRDADAALADAKRMHEITDAAASSARGAMERAEIVLLRHHADALASEVASGQDRARAAVQDLLDALEAGRAALGRLRDAAADMPMAQMRVAEHNRLVDATAVTNGNLGRIPPSDRPLLKPSPHRIDTSGLAVAVVDTRYEADIVKVETWLSPRPVTAAA